MLTWGRSRFQACEMSHAGPFFCLNMSFQEMVAANLIGWCFKCIQMPYPYISPIYASPHYFGFCVSPSGSPWGPVDTRDIPSNLRGCGWPRLRRTRCDPWPVACGSMIIQDPINKICENKQKKHQSHDRSHHHTVMIVISDVVMVLVCFSNRSDIIPRGCSCWFSTPFGRVFGLWVANKWHF